MKIIGLTGGIGAGKTRILQYMKDIQGAYICCADEVGHLLQQPGKVCYKEIVDFFGAEILDSNQKIDRGKLATAIFADITKRCVLDTIMHPRIKSEICAQIQVEQTKGTQYFVLEAALLIEDSYQEICDEIWYVYASQGHRRQRLKQTRGYSDEKIDAIFDAQLSENEYQAYCKHMIDNNGDFKETVKQIEALESRQDEIM